MNHPDIYPILLDWAAWISAVFLGAYVLAMIADGVLEYLEGRKNE